MSSRTSSDRVDPEVRARLDAFLARVMADREARTEAERDAERRRYAEFERRRAEEARRQRLRDGHVPRAKRSARVADVPELAGVDLTRDLLFQGPQGTGKTYAACALLAHRAAVRTVRYASFGEVLDAAFARSGMAKYRNVGVLVLDDVGKTAQTPATVECLRDLVDWRHEDGKQTVLTTSYSGAELLGRMERGSDVEHARDVRSRLRWFEVVRFGGPDRRSM